jgi:hypothetical protein
MAYRGASEHGRAVIGNDGVHATSGVHAVGRGNPYFEVALFLASISLIISM